MPDRRPAPRPMKPTLPGTAQQRIDIATWVLTALGLFAVLQLHLLAALLGGLLVYELVRGLAPFIRSRPIEADLAKIIVVALIAVLVVTALTGLILGSLSFLRSQAGDMSALLEKLAQIIDESRNRLPDWMLTYVPETADDLRAALSRYLRENAGMLQGAGTNFVRALAHVLVGMIIGGLISLREATAATKQRPLAAALGERAERISDSFRRVVFAQFWIAALNTTFTALYLGVVLPLMHVELPLTKTLIAVTFFCGLLPVLGNLISNAVIVLVSLSNSVMVAVGSLTYLIVIHKLEYFLNARIVGSRIRARAWELLMAMLVMEATFGIAGLIAAPIYYAYLKNELTAKDLV
jgi:predicted PurR-regulated permease PerM